MPFFNEFFRSPWAELKDYRDVQYVPRSLLDAALFAFRIVGDPKLTAEVAFRDIRLAAAFMAWIAYGVGRLLLRRPANKAADILMLCGFSSYALWLAGFGIYRYAVVLEMLAPVLVAIAWGLAPARAAWAGIAASLLALVAATQIAVWDRVPWQPRYVGVDAPALPANALVLMTGYEATSYVIPSFARNVRFVRIMSNYTHPFETTNGFNARMRALVDAHRGPLYSLFVSWEEWHNNQGLEIYGLKWRRPACTELKGTVMVAPILLCPLERP